VRPAVLPRSAGTGTAGHRRSGTVRVPDQRHGRRRSLHLAVERLRPHGAHGVGGDLLVSLPVPARLSEAVALTGGVAVRGAVVPTGSRPGAAHLPGGHLRAELPGGARRTPAGGGLGLYRTAHLRRRMADPPPRGRTLRAHGRPGGDGCAGDLTPRAHRFGLLTALGCPAP